MRMSDICGLVLFFFNDTATTEIYTLSLHDALPIFVCVKQVPDTSGKVAVNPDGTLNRNSMAAIINPDDMIALEQALKLKDRSEEHTSELQSRQYLVCRLLLEKKKNLTLYYL